MSTYLSGAVCDPTPNGNSLSSTPHYSVNKQKSDRSKMPMRDVLQALYAYLTNDSLNPSSRLNSRKNLMIHSKYESSLPDTDRSSVRRTCRTKLLKAECKISLTNCLNSSLSTESKRQTNEQNEIDVERNIVFAII